MDVLGNFLAIIVAGIVAFVMWLLSSMFATSSGFLGGVHIITFLEEIFSGAKDGFTNQEAGRHRGIVEFGDDLIAMILFTVVMLGGVWTVLGLFLYFGIKMETQDLEFGWNTDFLDEVLDDVRKYCRLVMGAMLIFASSAIVVQLTGKTFVGQDILFGAIRFVGEAAITPAAAHGSAPSAPLYGAIGFILYLIHLVLTLPFAAILIIGLILEFVNKAKDGWRQGGVKTGWVSVVDDLLSLGLLTATFSGGLIGIIGGIVYILWCTAVNEGWNFWSARWRQKVAYDIGNWAMLAVGLLTIYYSLHGTAITALIKLLLHDSIGLDVPFI